MGLLHVLLGRATRSRLLSAALGVLALVSGSAVSSHAAVVGFTGTYDVANWTLTSDPAGGSGSVNTALAPASVTITGSDNFGAIGYIQVDTDYTVVAAGTGLVSFDWSYSSTDCCHFDSFGYLLNGSFTQLVQNDTQGSGSTQFNVVQGDTFGFRVRSIDNCCGAGVATISSFDAPVPEPTSMAIFGIGALGMAYGARRRRRA
jgi:hypothetical protein